MTTQRETVVAAVFTRLQTLVGPTVSRGALPDEIPAGGLVTLVEGEATFVDETLGVVSRDYQLTLEIELAVQDSVDSVRIAALDALATAVATALNVDPDNGGDPTLGGVASHARLEELTEADDLPFRGADTVRGAVIPLTVHYSTGHNPMEAI